jgi:hypothetical protein
MNTFGQLWPLEGVWGSSSDNVFTVGSLGSILHYGKDSFPAKIGVNHSRGQPGSYFTITGQNFPPLATASVYVNNHLIGTVSTDTSGNVAFQISTNVQAQLGGYIVTVSVNPQASTLYMLEPTAPLHVQGSGPVLSVPQTIEPALTVYLPIIY